MGGRTHDYHCRNCHQWVNGFAVDDGATCGCGRWDGFYDLNNEGCRGEEDPCWEDFDQCGEVLAIDQGNDHWILACLQPEGHLSPHSGAIVWPNTSEAPDA